MFSRPEAATFIAISLTVRVSTPTPHRAFQPDGPHAPSQVIDPGTFRWTDDQWRGIELPGQVLYELHVGTFTVEGTWKAAARELQQLKELGITCIEVMPVAAFPGRFGWGYDGVSLFAPYSPYGSPDDFRQFVDDAHRLGLGVILDVVYNHLGPDGAYHKEFSEDYYNNSRDKTEWGAASTLTARIVDPFANSSFPTRATGLMNST